MSGAADDPTVQAAPLRHPSKAALEALVDQGLQLWRDGRAFEATELLTDAYQHGLRDPDFLQEYLDLLTGEARFMEVLQRSAELGGEGVTNSLGQPLLRAHAKLALQRNRVLEMSLAAEREAGDAWLGPEALLRRLERACLAREPFSFVRLGDGEARFLIAREPGLQAGLETQEAKALGEVVWFNWFGSSLSQEKEADVADLFSAYTRAIDGADILGVADVQRMTSDTSHYGYLAAQEEWLRSRPASRAVRQQFTSALGHQDLDRLTPHLGRLLKGAAFIGVVSPHPDLARRLADRHGIAEHASYVVPGEGRLQPSEGRRAGAHFTQRYLEVVDSLSPPSPGAIFLVAAGLLGKVYCDRIKQLGGIALDIGSLADAWMGFDTRNGKLADARPLVRAAFAGRETIGCLSLGKTGSMALASAIRDAGFPDAVHLHYFGPRARAIKRVNPEPMLALADEMSQRIDDTRSVFRFVTSIRDPVERILSQAFYRAEKSALRVHDEVISSPASLMNWWDANPMSKRDYWTEWFDDTYLIPFGFDFREHAFNQQRKSLRFNDGRLKLLVLRHHDDADIWERELGWLLDMPRLKIPRVNSISETSLWKQYEEFKTKFRPPSAWLDAAYSSLVIKHFFSNDELAFRRQRWGG